ncbi:hypothetical protein CQ13_36200 [Bradyrhizobium retamae]|uniref:Uncharacterized protein n=1 Tax=Bradyrhizobium retamae TaxID=1300035 RepID=A0A0R3MIB6_9BRAD|nr:hypothetical protein CQ13_36200 [Bradyrhizobium retamae]
MQAIPAVIHVLRMRRMQLHHALLFIPKQVFDEAHLFPVRTTSRRRDGDMLPTWANKSDYPELAATRPLNKKEAART